MDEPVIYRPPLLVMIPLADEILAWVVQNITGSEAYDSAIMVYCGPRADQPISADPHGVLDQR